jgi:hypothetical protein
MVVLSLRELEEFDPKYKNNRFCCPLCGNSKSIESKHRSLWVDKSTGVWFCHRCDNKGLLLEWHKEHLSSNNTSSTYKHSSNYSHQPKPIDEKKLARVREEYRGFTNSFSYSPGQHYLLSRGIEPELALASGCGFGYWKHWFEDEKGKYFFVKDKRVCFPIHNQSNEVVAMSARAISGDCLEPTHTVRGYKSHGVFSTPGALEINTLIVVEAPIDALSLAMAGFPAIATVGTSWPDWLVEIASKKSLILIGFDNDAPGNAASLKFTDQLSNTSTSIKAKRILPSRKDWNKILTTDGLDSLKSEVNSSISSDYFPIADDTNSLDCYRLTY